MFLKNTKKNIAQLLSTSKFCGWGLWKEREKKEHVLSKYHELLMPRLDIAEIPLKCQWVYIAMCTKLEGCQWDQQGFPGVSVGMRICLQWRRPSFYPLVGKHLWRRKGQPTPEFLPGESQGQRNLEGPQSMGLQRSWTWLSDRAHMRKADPPSFKHI